MRTRETFAESLALCAELLGVTPGENAMGLCEAHFCALVAANETTNLTRVTTPLEAAQKHYADSLLPLRFGLVAPGARVLDLGSGAGFPGLPLYFFRPDIKLTLLDSQKKRADFLRLCQRDFAPDADVLHMRAEEAARKPQYRMAFDVVVSRAIAELPVLLELTLPFLKDGGAAIAYKGPKATEEAAGCANALKVLSGKMELLSLDTPWGARTLAVTTKRGRIPITYPRKAGILQKLPL